MHRTEALPNFVQVQSEHMAKKLKTTPEEAKARLDKIVYKGLEKYFNKIKPCRGSVEFIRELKEHGYKIALLSDFPPEQKGEIWGIKEMCDFLIGSEEAGALKPHPVPFKKLAEGLGLPPEQILYIGNNHKYDVVGSKNVGMKAAWLISPIEAVFGKKSKIGGKFSRPDGQNSQIVASTCGFVGRKWP
jgi:putative hydrolase of the HAD superfamily